MVEGMMVAEVEGEERWLMGGRKKRKRTWIKKCELPKHPLPG